MRCGISPRSTPDQRIGGAYVGACRDDTKMLEFVEEALNEVLLAVEDEIAW
jgi:hypothetical protein